MQRAPNKVQSVWFEGEGEGNEAAKRLKFLRRGFPVESLLCLLQSATHQLDLSHRRNLEDFIEREEKEKIKSWLPIKQCVLIKGQSRVGILLL